MDYGNIIVAVISLLGTLIGTFTGILTSTKLTNYRIEQLEKKVEKHNSVMEKTAILQNDVKSLWHSIDEMKSDIHSMEHGRKED